ncbi:MAG: hypothetical protein LDL31_05120 [Prosthecobacter sp.]|jgi:hypothetical protein|nr:hypothetical protein [Prosthecobacter sp.]
MFYLNPLLPVFIVLLLVAGGTAKPRLAAAASLGSAWARLGYGLAKISLLVLPLQWLGYLFQNADPIAISAKAIWLACLAQTLQLVLLITGTTDLIIAVRAFCGRTTQELPHAPLRSATLFGLWQRLLPAGVWGHTRHPFHAIPALLLIAGLGALWHGSVLCSLVWVVFHATCVALETWRGRGLFSPLPVPIQVMLNLLLLLATSVLLISPTLSQAATYAGFMVEGRPQTLHTLLLDQRLTTAWLQIALSLSVIVSVALPRLGWLLELPMRTWRIVGMCLLPIALLLPWREAQIAPAWLRQAAQWPVSYLVGEGNSHVHHGYDGWLFDQTDLDARTQRRQPGLAATLPELVHKLKEAGTETLIVPLPAKLALHPEYFLRAEYPAPVQPPGHRLKLEKLAAAAVPIFDPTQMLWDRKLKAPAFYPTDRHWTFEAMKDTASALAKHVREKHAALCGQDTPLINATILEREEAGDLARQLLPRSPSSLFSPQTAQLVSISGMEPDVNSPILLAGGQALRVFEEADSSFGNADGRPQRAGFATQLALLLGRRLAVLQSLEAPAWIEAARGKKLLILLVEADLL